MQIPIDIQPGLNSDDTTYAAAPAWADGSNVRFRLGRPQTIGGWESLTASLVSGVCRAVLAWTDNNNATLNIAFGSHSPKEIENQGLPVRVVAQGNPVPGKDVAVLKADAGLHVARVHHIQAARRLRR